jgi:hypothetical protein
MRRLLPFLAALAALVPSAALAVGCGDSSEEFTVSAAQAAEATRAANAAKITLTATISGAGLPVPMTVKGQGVTATGEPKMDLTFDLGSLLALAGAPGDGRTRVLLDGSRVFVDPPAVKNLKLPGGATWVTADIGKVLGALGVDATGFGELLRISPDQQLGALKAAGSVKEVGREQIDGEQTVHLRGTVKPSDYLAALPADRRAAAEKALKELEKLPGASKDSLDQTTPVDMWVGEDKLLRRMIQKTTIPAQRGVPQSTMQVRMDLRDYGTKLDVAAPPKAEVYDATDDLERALKQSAQGAAGGGLSAG